MTRGAGADSDRLVPPADMRDIGRRILEAAGAPMANARIVADHLVEASLAGVDTHGIVHLPLYVAAIRAGHLDPGAAATIDMDSPTSARIRGHWGFGHVAADLATRTGIAKAETEGSAVIAVVECGHIGRVGHYVEAAAQAGCVGLVFAGGYGVEAPAAVPFQGRQPVLHTNPIAFAFPAGDEPGPMFDFATTMVAGMRVAEAKRLGERVPPGSIVDSEGLPSDDPHAFSEGGALAPFGGHKGYGIMAQAEWLGRILTGSDAFSHGSPAEPVMRHQGALAIFIRADLFAPMGDVQEGNDAMVRRIRAVKPAPGVDRVRLPGDPERTARAHRDVNGIPIDAGAWQRIVDTAEGLGVTL